MLMEIFFHHLFYLSLLCSQIFLVKQQKCTPSFCLYGGICKEPEDPTKPPFCICKTNKFVPPNCGTYVNTFRILYFQEFHPFVSPKIRVALMLLVLCFLVQLVLVRQRTGISIRQRSTPFVTQMVIAYAKIPRRRTSPGKGALWEVSGTYCQGFTITTPLYSKKS
jgi:hypothetical protein